MGDKVHFSGEIVKVTPDGRSAIVQLDRVAAGYGVAVISPDTSGRVTLMNGKGELELGARVSGEGRRGPEALQASNVRHG